jgi:cyclopropane-fatty-acyl-phospholipid synthase
MTAIAQDSYLTFAHEVMQDLLRIFPERPFTVRLPDGSEIPPEPARLRSQFTFVLNRPSALRKMFFPPSELYIGESYIYGDYDIEGDIVAAFGFIQKSQKLLSLKNLFHLGWKLMRLEKAEPSGWSNNYQNDPQDFTAYTGHGEHHSPERDRRAIQFHYDLSNDFYRLWLDERMIYSCAYFADESESLEAAQIRKLDHICRKLNLQPGERLLDIGCGWGGLLIHAAKHYGAKAMGISISEEQTKEARARFSQQGVADQCQIEIVHYEAFQPETPFDKLVSVGMFEHLGPDKLQDYFAKCLELLKPGGLFLLQGASSQGDYRHLRIGLMDRLGLGRHAFYQKYSFPDSELVDIATISQLAESVGFETRDVENLREHYALTLRHWLHQLESNHDAAVSAVGEVAYRCWHLLVAFSKYFMEMGLLAEFQTLLGKPTEDGRLNLPLIRP